MKNFLLILCLLSISSLSFAQLSCDRWTLGFDFNYLTPDGEIKSNCFHDAIGLDIDVFYNLTGSNSSLQTKGVSFHIGGRFRIVGTPGEKNNILLATPADASATHTMFNGLIDLQLVGRAVWNTGTRFQPYGEIFTGPRFLGGFESINLDESYQDFEDNTTEQITSGAVMATGISLGSFYRINEKVDLNFRVGYTRSEAVDYLDLDSYDVKENVPSYTTVNAITEDLNFHLGVRIKFSCDNDCDEEEIRRSERRARRSYRSDSRYRRNANRSNNNWNNGCGNNNNSNNRKPQTKTNTNSKPKTKASSPRKNSSSKF